MKYPFLPNGRTIKYVPDNNPFIKSAETYARKNTLDPAHPTGAVIVKNGEILGQGTNAGPFHKYFGCIRKIIKAPTGKLYGLCPGCQSTYHAEQNAIRDTLRKRHQTHNADLYLFGHWWCCEGCWKAMIKAGIKNVYLAESTKP